MELPGGGPGVAEVREFETPPSVGDTISLTYLVSDPRGGVVHLTAASPIEQVDPKTAPKGRVVVGNVIEMNRGGLAVDLGGVRGFLPIAQIARGLETVPVEFQRRRVAAEVRGVDAKRGEIMLTLRDRLERREQRQKREAMSRLERGQVLEGKVVRMNQHGAFIDVGGVDGLLHDTRIRRHLQESDTPQKIEVGGFVKVEILDVDPERGRVGLAIPREDESPTTFSDLVGEFEAGEKVMGMVQEVRNDGCTVLLDEQVKGWLPRDHFDGVGSAIRRGSLVEAVVDSIDLGQQRIQLRPR
ncbi:MAG: 30S ribosomal protein S1 [Planctomycetes bacterium]|nr:30S ribosomal protein S1 [Planctomycetota bacterium]